MLPPLSVHQFEKRFFQEACPFWTAHDAANKREMVGKFRNDDSDLVGDDLLRYSWMQFEELVETYPSGHIRINCKSAPTSTAQNAPTLYVRWGTMETMPMGRTGKYPVAGAGNWSMAQSMLQLQQQHFDKMLEMQNELLRLNFENRQLAERLEADEQPDLKETVLMEGIGIIKQALAPKVSVQPAAVLGTLGQKTECHYGHTTIKSRKYRITAKAI